MIVTTHRKIEVLRLLAEDHSLGYVSTHLDVPPEDIINLANAYGGLDDRARLGWAADELEKQMVTPPSNGFTPAEEPLVLPDEEPLPVKLGDLIRTGKKSDVAKTKRLAEKIEKDLAVLREAVTKEETARREAVRAANVASAARTRIEELDRERAELAALLPVKPKKKSGTHTTRANPEVTKIREWAKAQGAEVNDRGRLPQAVRDAYARAMETS